jgi:spermidine synthase
MDSAETTSERLLAHLGYGHGPADGRMLIGGLGLGYTASEALQLAVGCIDVVELEPALVEWAHRGVTPVLAAVAADPRVQLLVGDVTDTLTAPVHEPWDAILLDVDNGPDFLIHESNASLYTEKLLHAAYERLAPGGRLAIWCQGASPALLRSLQTISPGAEEHLLEVRRGDRRLTYAVCTLDRP